MVEVVVMARYWQTRAYARPAPQPVQTDAERWQAFCASIVGTIEQIRAEEAPLSCPSCGCTAHPPAETRRCPVCGLVKDMAAFARNGQRANGRAHECRECKAAWLRQHRQRNKVRMFKQAVRGVAV